MNTEQQRLQLSRLISAATGRHSSRRRRVARSVASWLAFVFIFTFMWTILGPAQLGGQAHYVIVDGPSMEPTYDNGDLVVALTRVTYEVGDVVVYQPDVGQDFPVIHRIVKKQGPGTYVTQGDNRDEPDGWLATDANIFGAAQFHVPNGGRFVILLRTPGTWLAVALGFLGLALIAGAVNGRESTASGKRGRHLNPRRLILKPLLLIATVLSLAATTANAAPLVVDGGVLQQFRVESVKESDAESSMVEPSARSVPKPITSSTSTTSTTSISTSSTTTTTPFPPTTTTTLASPADSTPPATTPLEEPPGPTTETTSTPSTTVPTTQQTRDSST